MAKLKNIDIPDVADKKAKNTIPTVTVPGDAVTRYSNARELVDRGTATMNELKPTLLAAGLEAVFIHNCEHAADPKALISSVNLMDRPLDEDDDDDAAKAAKEASAPEDSRKEVVMCSWTKKNMESDCAQVEAMFNGILTTEGKKPNINNYYGFDLVGNFDTSVFMVGGKFNQDRYDMFMDALKAVSDHFGVSNPLSCTKQWLPKGDFHERRWTQFDLETNLELHKVLPTQVNLKPIRPAK